MDVRVNAIIEAATDLFLRQGYARTQISHIAKAIGVSVGTIYHDFAGKKEIMHMVLQTTIDPAYLDRDFAKPITDEPFADIEGEIAALLKKTGEDFAVHLLTDGDGYTFDAMVGDAFDLLARYAVGCLFIEKNQYEFPYLAEEYRLYRKQFFVAMESYIDRFAKNGDLRPLKHPALTARLIIETLSWWAMDQRYIAFEHTDISLSLAKEVCMDNILSAYKR